jgi:hypothetical protein
MPKEVETFGGNKSDVKFDEKKFGVRKPSEEDLQEWRDNGWLGEDGICHFPRDVQAYPSGWKAKLPPQFWNKATEAQIAEAIEKGWIMFADGNGVYFTLNEYKAEYPEFPDPEFIMRLEERIPPKKGSVIEVGRREIVKIG